jgi:hypothetical protein
MYAHSRAIESLGERVGAFWERTGRGFNKFMNLILSLTPTIKAALGEIFDWLVIQWDKFPNRIRTGLNNIAIWLRELPAKIVAAFKGLGEKIKPHLPGFLQLLMGKGGSLSPLPTGAPITPSSSVVNNKGGSNSKVNVQNNMTITQLPGEDSTSFGHKVVKILSEKTGIAVASTDSGVDY